MSKFTNSLLALSAAALLATGPVALPAQDDAAGSAAPELAEGRPAWRKGDRPEGPRGPQRPGQRPPRPEGPGGPGGPGGPEGPGGPPHHGPGGPGGEGNDLGRLLHNPMVAMAIDLTDEQLEAIKADGEARREANKEVAEQARELRKQLRELLTGEEDPNPAMVEQLAQEIGTLETKLGTERALHAAKIREILTPEQEAKLRKIVKHLRRDGHGRPGHEGPGGPGGPGNEDGGDDDAPRGRGGRNSHQFWDAK
jgi:Spy/CpxP family protein refolding chaperone